MVSSSATTSADAAETALETGLAPTPAPARSERWVSAKAAFWPVLFVFLLLGFTRSWLATRLDGFTVDEAWHVVAGASYARRGDYRLNPEHPPLVKLWVGQMLSEDVFHLPPFRPLADKADERDFTDDTAYLKNDVERVQHHVRLAMFGLNALLLLGFALALRRSFGPGLALAVVGLLLLDPTLAAHLPVALTDLPVALLAATAALLAAQAFRSWKALDLVLASLALGLTLSAKHSGVVAGIFVLGFGAIAVVRERLAGGGRALVARRSAQVAGVLFGAYLTLWSFYSFRFAEASPDELKALPVAVVGSKPGDPEAFNRSMADKIADLHSPLHRAVLDLAVQTHVLPRAYLWGLADIVRAGVEGRQEVLYIFGTRYEEDTPWFFFLAVLAAKIPLGLSALALAGLWLLVRRRVPEEWRWPALGLLGWGAVFLVCLMRGNSGYAGIRHAVPMLPVFAFAGGLGLVLAWRMRPRWPAFAAAGLVAAFALSALPVVRPWEYYNELVGGPDQGWRAFTDDGLDNNQRRRELAQYYDAHVRGTGKHAYDYYGISHEEAQARGIDFHSLEEDTDDSDVLSGTVFVNAREITPRRTYDLSVFRETPPTARFGNLLVFEGDYHVPWLRAARRWTGIWEALSHHAHDPARAERLLREVMDIYPQDYHAAFALGNLRLERNDYPAAVVAYRSARENAPPGALVAALDEQIATLQAPGASGVRPLRDPWLE
ncbi:MAG TPA: tetratricopeptide repeat protein [Polyangiaceae bacterium]|nr:tetratricopeptide repeat protein [Polyangiaceae bacterium]